MPKEPTDRSVEEVLDGADRIIGGGLVESKLGLVLAKVVYLGSRRNRHLPLKGRIGQDKFEDEIVEEVQASGFTPYDFSTHDLRGRQMTAKLISMKHPIHRVRGKPFVTCKHPDHLWSFHRMRDGDGNPEFEILASGLDAQKIDEYFLRRTRTLRVVDEDFNHVRQNATASDAVGAV
jgi:hypothetical protein